MADVIAEILPRALNGLSFGALLFLIASGLTLTFGLMRTLNLAHGAFYLLGGYIALDLLRRTDSYWVGLGGALLFVGLLGLIFERLLLHRFIGRELPQIILTIGLAFIISDLVLGHYGGAPATPPRPPGLQGSFTVGSFTFPWFRLGLIVIAVVVWAGLWLLVNRTRAGAVIRAAVDDQEMARAIGIRVPVIFMVMFSFGAALAAFAGVWGGAFTGLAPGEEFQILILALVVVVVGGLGSVNGALLAAALVGLVDEFGRALFPEFAFFTVFAPVALLLALRPQGLFGKAAT
ncbi:branched-chain amino acid ABC transporter permease [Blastococcus sp. CT_GayMR20]|uniref:branched-chain amino acid ABC transporter permease n=1 Tax=Blastococcus sp. CT_GayMR20 TaxID=2559609 RepID=UPI0014310B85|nr:branched-chain amino acid ABC transporter permease [Blastococcus sp. CT_GayMR20]